MSYREWINLPEPQRTYVNFKNMFIREYQIQNEMSQITANQAGYTNNAENQYNNEELRNAIQNLTNAATADRAAFEQLTLTNARLENQIQHLYEQNMQLAQANNVQHQNRYNTNLINSQPAIQQNQQ